MKHEEERLQIACVKWFDLQYPEYRMMMHHSPNGGYRTAAEARIFKAMGTRAGFPDLVLLRPKNGFSLLGIEMKTDKGKLSGYQKEYQEFFQKNGMEYKVVRNLDEFMAIVTDWMK